jgi:hypothetical protein
MSESPMPDDMAAEYLRARLWTLERATERELVEEVEPEAEWRPELLRWVPLDT